MRILCLIALAWPLLAAQPAINVNGIVRSDSARPGLLEPGILFSIWGHNFGPDVQVLLDGAPLEVQFASDVQINARMPLAAGADVSKLVVVSGGVRSEGVEVRRAPEVAVISLDGVARVGGPVWIRVQLPHGSVAYPASRLGLAADFGCASFEVRKEGKLLPTIAPPRRGFGGSFGTPPGCVHQGPPGPAKRLPLHLQFSFDEPGIYEVRSTHYGFLGRSPNDVHAQSAWTAIQVLPAEPRRPIGVHPGEPGELVTSFLPNLLAVRDDETLSVLMEYLYHPEQQVRAWALSALPYWPDSIAQPRLMMTLRAKGPTDVLVQAIKGNASEVVDISLPFLLSDNSLLFQGAIRAAAIAVQVPGEIDDTLRKRVAAEVSASVSGNLGHADANMTNELISVMGQIHSSAVHDLLWKLVDRHTGTEQALIAITWHKDPSDLKRLADYLSALPTDGETGRQASAAVYSMHYQFGDAAVPWLRDVLAKTRSRIVSERCAEELARVK